ncbi:unnamed protein product [Tilletia laevis]|uniref:Uncharacterized protein n=2 Tax=Tilletia TaxID=13289 RepID=A0A9N8QEK2_9BASI|nr:hypothetical protein A4X03_0g7991 [Tilletia caries]CAD6926066.1 unnamed protein product [Tilletia laevis]CAD6932652.1 unnamed protein product [Tilletia caries]CAD7066115.1 unnamed protein product [Tilletia caries]
MNPFTVYRVGPENNNGDASGGGDEADNRGLAGPGRTKEDRAAGEGHVLEDTLVLERLEQAILEVEELRLNAGGAYLRPREEVEGRG